METKQKFIKSGYVKLNLDKIYKTDFTTEQGNKIYNIAINENLSVSLLENDINFKDLDIRIKYFLKDNETDRLYGVYDKINKNKIDFSGNELINLFIDNGYVLVDKSFKWDKLTEAEKIAFLTK